MMIIKLLPLSETVLPVYGSLGPSLKQHGDGLCDSSSALIAVDALGEEKKKYARSRDRTAAVAEVFYSSPIICFSMGSN